MNPQAALQTFDFNSTPVRAIELDGQPWFVAADVCRVLEIANTTNTLRSLDADEKNTLGNTKGHSGQRGGAQSFNIINESGLYALIFKSRKAQAKVFRKWVTAEVLPQIRKTGAYLSTQLDFIKYPVAKEFSDIFHWLRTLSVDPNEAAGVARAILQSSLRERRREIPATSSRNDEEPMARRDMQRLVEIVVSFMRGSESHEIDLGGVIHLSRKHRLFGWMFSPEDSRHISSATRIGFGLLMSRFQARTFAIGAESFSFERVGSKNVRRFRLSRLSQAVS